jgi:hypothetical protein
LAVIDSAPSGWFRFIAGICGWINPKGLLGVALLAVVDSAPSGWFRFIAGASIAGGTINEATITEPTADRYAGKCGGPTGFFGCRWHSFSPAREASEKYRNEAPPAVNICSQFCHT